VDPALLKSLDIVSIDFKGPSAGVQAVSNEEAIRHALTEAYRTMQVKFLVKDQADYDFAKAKIRQFCEDEHLADPFIIYIIGPVGGLDMRELAEKVLADPYLGGHTNVRVGAQVHKLLWGSKRGV